VHAAALSLLRITVIVASLALAGAALITQPVLGSFRFPGDERAQPPRMRDDVVRNYWRAGIPAVLVTDTAYLRNPNNHTRNDTAGTLDYVRMARVVDGVYSAVIHTSH